MTGRFTAAIIWFALISISGASAQSPSVTGTGTASAETVQCRVIYDDVSGNDHRYTDDRAIVRASEVQELPSEPPVPRGLNEGTLGIPDVTTKFTKHIQTKEGEILETYEGAFTKIVGDEKFVPFGDRVVMKPDIWWPASHEDDLEVYTAQLPALHLRALWIGKPHFGSQEPPSLYYFAISVQLFSRKFHLKTALFSGKKTSGAEDGAGRKEVVGLKDSPVADLSLDEDESWEHEILPRCAAFRTSP